MQACWLFWGYVIITFCSLEEIQLPKDLVTKSLSVNTRRHYPIIPPVGNPRQIYRNLNNFVIQKSTHRTNCPVPASSSTNETTHTFASAWCPRSHHQTFPHNQAFNGARFAHTPWIPSATSLLNHGHKFHKWGTLKGWAILLSLSSLNLCKLIGVHKHKKTQFALSWTDGCSHNLS